MPGPESNDPAVPLFEPDGGPGNVEVDHASRALEIQPLGGDITGEQQPRHGRMVPPRWTKPLEDHPTREPHGADARAVAGQPGHARATDRPAEMVHRRHGRGEHHRGPPIRHDRPEQGSLPVTVALPCGHLGVEPPEHGPVAKRQIARDRPWIEQLPHHQLIRRRVDDAAKGGPMDRMSRLPGPGGMVEQPLVAPEGHQQGSGARSQRAEQRDPDQPADRPVARQLEPVQCLENLAESGIARTPISRGRDAPRGQTEWRDPSDQNRFDRGREDPAREPFRQRGQSGRCQRIVPIPERQLGREIGWPIDHRRGGEQHHQTIGQEGQQVAVPPSEGVTEMVAFVDDQGSGAPDAPALADQVLAGERHAGPQAPA